MHKALKYVALPSNVEKRLHISEMQGDIKGIIPIQYTVEVASRAALRRKYAARREAPLVFYRRLVGNHFFFGETT